MVTIRSRKYGDNNQVMLSVRIKDSKHDNAIALGVSVDAARWESIDQTLKQAAAAHKRGLSIFIEDALTSKLWKLLRDLSAMQKAGVLTTVEALMAIQATFNDNVPTEFHAPAQPQQTKITFIEFVSQYIKECESGDRLKKKSTTKIKAGSIKSYKGLLAQLEAYQQKRHLIVDWDDINFDFYHDYKHFLIEKDYSPNTIARHIKDMKTILYAAKDMHYTTRDDFMSKQWSADREDVDNVYITNERIKEMATFDISDYQAMKECAKLHSKDKEESDRLIHALKRDIYRQRLAEARDIFLMGCYTGQRVSDYKRINSGMIETLVGADKYLHIKQEKTGKDVYITYTEEMRAILERYHGALPKVYDQHLNERIKVVGLLLGWTEPAGLEEHRGLMRYTSDKRFCDAIKTHTARRSFATNAYKDGIPLSAIMAVTGHSSEEMLKRYLKLGSKERAILAAEEFKKIRRTS